MADMINDGPEDDRHLRTIAAHTSAYITHVRRQLKHTLPKAIVHCLVRVADLPLRCFHPFAMSVLCALPQFTLPGARQNQKFSICRNGKCRCKLPSVADVVLRLSPTNRRVDLI